MSRRATSLVFGVVAFLSGVAALGWEMLWLRRLGELVGSTRTALAVVLAVMFGGLALGTLVGPRLVRRLGGVKTLVGAELVIAAFGLVQGRWMLVVEGWLDASWIPAFGVGGLPVAWSLASALVLFVPAVAMGVTWPALVRLANAARRPGGLYAANTFGGVVGVQLATFVGIRWLGLDGTGYVAAALNGCVALLALTVRGGEATDESPSGPVRSPRAMLAAATLAGVASIGLEVAWSRALAPHLGGTVYSFAVVLMVYLLALATGGALDAVVARRVVDARKTAGFFALAAGVGALASAWFLGAMATAHAGFATHFGDEAELVFGILFLPVVGFGAFLPAIARAYAADERGVARAWAANVGGGVLGSPLTAFLLLPVLGLRTTLVVLAFVAAVLGVVVGVKRTERGGWLVAVLVASFFLWRFADDPRVWREAETDRLVAYNEGSAAAVSVVETRSRGRVLKIDGTYRLGSSASGFAQRRQGLIPLLLAPKPERALFLGVATGSSVGATVRWPLERTVGVELVPGVLDYLPLFSRVNDGISLAQPRGVELVEADAKFWVRTSTDEFDVIVGDLFVPWRAGEGSMYTREHFTAVSERLAPGGIFVQWLPLYQLPTLEFKTVLATFLSVFADVHGVWLYFQAEQPALGLLGSNEPWSLPSDLAERIRERAEWLERDGLTDVDELVASVMFDVGELRTLVDPDGELGSFGVAGLETRDHPRVEFGAPWSIGGKRTGIAADNLDGLLAVRDSSREPDAGGAPSRAACLEDSLAAFLAARREWNRVGAAGHEEATVELFLRAVEAAPSEGWGFLDYELERFREQARDRGADGAVESLERRLDEMR